jgi:hypothetical protein
MAHFVYVNDDNGDLVDLIVYCSDYCARTDIAYDGWNGAHELEGCDECASCGDVLRGYAHGNANADSYCRRMTA